MQAGQRDAGFAALSELGGIGCAEPVKGEGNLAIEREEAHVLAAHHGVGVEHAIFAENGRGGSAQALSECRIVIGDGRAFSYGDGGHAIGGNAIGLGESVGGAADVGDDLVALGH